MAGVGIKAAFEFRATMYGNFEWLLKLLIREHEVIERNKKEEILNERAGAIHRDAVINKVKRLLRLYNI